MYYFLTVCCWHNIYKYIYMYLYSVCIGRFALWYQCQLKCVHRIFNTAAYERWCLNYSGPNIYFWNPKWLLQVLLICVLAYFEYHIFCWYIDYVDVWQLNWKRVLLCTGDTALLVTGWQQSIRPATDTSIGTCASLVSIKKRGHSLCTLRKWQHHLATVAKDANVYNMKPVLHKF